MKTIFRSLNMGLILASIIALGAVAGFAQDPNPNCADADGQSKMQDEFDVLYKKGRQDFDARQKAIDSGKAFLDKYGVCESTKERSDWLKINIPKMETNLAADKDLNAKNALLARFDTALKSKNWDEVYASGKEILSKYPDEYRTAELVLGSVGGEEAFKNNFKYSDDTLRFAKQSIADLEAGKPFIIGGKPTYGLSLKDVYNFGYPNKDDAIGWMNLYIGYITQVGQKNKLAAAPYLFKASQAASESAKSPTPFELIGGYYFDELNKLVTQIQAKVADQKDTDAPDVAQKKVDEIKALVAMSNGTSERAMDAFSRAFTLGKEPAYKARMKKNVQDAYKVRFGKTDGVDAWIASAVAKPFINPTTPITPISDPDPVVTTTPAGAGTGPATTPGRPGMTPAKPPVTPAGAPPKKPAAVMVKKKPVAAKKTV